MIHAPAFGSAAAGTDMANEVRAKSDRDSSLSGRAGSNGALWPTYRHDSALTGFSPLKGGLDKAPSVLWSADLGGPTVAAEQVRLEDFDGDGRVELLRILPDRLICQDLRGRLLWDSGGLANLVVDDIRDLAGDGTRGILVTARANLERRHYAVSGRSGKRTLLYTSYNEFGGSRRLGHILPGVRGQQLCLWWSATVMSGGDVPAYGCLWSFEQGVDDPTVRFKVEESGVIYAPQHLFADMDGDGRTEMVMISHEQMWLYDLETGVRKAYAAFPPQIRSYVSYIAALPLASGELPSLLLINPHIPGVEVIRQDGKSVRRVWKQVVGPAEDQYQEKVKITAGARNPFVDLDGDGQVEILAAVANEHDDGLTHLVIFGAKRGERLLDAADLKVLAIDDLDGDGKPEVLLQSGDTLRIADWNGKAFVNRWQGKGAQPLLQPERPEGILAAGTSVGANMPLWRATPGGREFLMRFPDGVWSCRLATGGGLVQVAKAERHPALGNADPPKPAVETFRWDGHTLVTLEQGKEVARWEMPQRRAYLAPPALVGMLEGERRVVVRDSDGRLVSYSERGDDRRVILEGCPTYAGAATICDLDGDGAQEVVAHSVDAQGRACVAVADGRGQVKRRIYPPGGVSDFALGPTGRLGAGQGRWLVLTYAPPYDLMSVAAYDGKTGAQLWVRHSYGLYGTTPVKFVLHVPTAVYDYDGDDADDLLAASENFYGIISVKDNRDLVPAPLSPPLSDTIPGHWTAYATPMVAPILGGGEPQVFFSRSFALVLVTDLRGRPIWHYGLTRDTTPVAHPALADLRGDGKLGAVIVQPDGLLRAFDAGPLDRKCPTCRADQPLTDVNHSGSLLWEFRLPPPVQDLACADLDGDAEAELLCGAGDGALYALKTTAGVCRILWSVPLGAAVGAPVVADVNGDGRAEIVVATEDGKIHCLGRGAG